MSVNDAIAEAGAKPVNGDPASSLLPAGAE